MFISLWYLLSNANLKCELYTISCFHRTHLQIWMQMQTHNPPLPTHAHRHTNGIDNTYRLRRISPVFIKFTRNGILCPFVSFCNMWTSAILSWNFSTLSPPLRAIYTKRIILISRKLQILKSIICIHFEITTWLFTLVMRPEHFNNFIGNIYQWKTYCECRQMLFETVSGKTHACLQIWHGLLRSNTEAEIHNKKIQGL